MINQEDKQSILIIIFLIRTRQSHFESLDNARQSAWVGDSMFLANDLVDENLERFSHIQQHASRDDDVSKVAY